MIVTGNGHIRLPYRRRRRVSLFVEDRVLLLGRSSTARLLVYPRPRSASWWRPRCR
ncbi:hypothetical protein [Nocardia sp. NPDC057030]|uniref:hypothetical protein n=1 Tax=unclassified Nocardia TaxID=2637762 RepID=UPI003638EFF1